MFDTFERSADAGEPIFLFDFSTGTAHWRYTTADRQITHVSNPYDPAPITAGNIVQGQEIKQKTIKITIPRDLQLALVLQNFPPSTDVMLTVFSLHYTDPDAQAIVIWIGRVMQQNQKDSTIELSCEPAYTGIQTQGLRRRWQLNCPHVLYGLACGITASNYQVATTLTAVSGVVVSSADFVPPAGLSFAGGYLEWDSGKGYQERRSINSVSGTDLTLAYGSPDLSAGLSVTAFPGCRHTMADCKNFPVSGSTVGNLANFGGDPYIPTKNPFDGNPVF